MKPGSKTALITGIGGQDGSYLAELLLDRGYAVHGLVRRSSGLNRERIDGLRAAGRMSDCVCTEASPFEPVSPYAIAKQYAHSMTAF